MPRPTTIAELRSLVAAWTPTPSSRSVVGVATGVPRVDDALGGGLPRGRVTEVVSATLSSGGELFFGALLASTRAARLRVALIDAADGFAPKSHGADLLRHLVWVRARSLPEALSCADVLMRDGNYAVIVLDLRGVPARLLRQQPASAWHRIRLMAEQSPGAILIQSPFGFMPAVPWRLVFRGSANLGDLRRSRAERIAGIQVDVLRGQPTGEEMTG